ncbi:hypothetical protein NKH52_15950 [Mesorhizobium sp. M1066]|uniref:hypothetical protein n=1 Tax=unclassified Mesorhizobium TaxID=325217 RepID=UPI00333D64BD
MAAEATALALVAAVIAKAWVVVVTAEALAALAAAPQASAPASVAATVMSAVMGSEGAAVTAVTSMVTATAVTHITNIKGFSHTARDYRSLIESGLHSRWGPDSSLEKVLLARLPNCDFDLDLGCVISAAMQSTSHMYS